MFAVIHNAAYRRPRRRRYFNKVEFLLVGNLTSSRDRHNAELLTVRTNQTDFSVLNLTVDLKFFNESVLLSKKNMRKNFPHKNKPSPDDENSFQFTRQNKIRMVRAENSALTEIY